MRNRISCTDDDRYFSLSVILQAIRLRLGCNYLKEKLLRIDSNSPCGILSLPFVV